jgi:hypothetical protein
VLIDADDHLRQAGWRVAIERRCDPESPDPAELLEPVRRADCDGVTVHRPDDSPAGILSHARGKREREATAAGLLDESDGQAVGRELVERRGESQRL